MIDLVPLKSTIIVALLFLLKNKIFLSPDQLYQKHRKILDNCDKNKEIQRSNFTIS